ncbi:MAG: acetyl-CoA carboxylase biotin carboxyl carrier protein [Oscillospiraceae bacterium]
MDVFNPTLETIESIAKIVNNNELSEISVKVGDVELTVKGKKCPPPPPPAVMPSMPVTAAAAENVQKPAESTQKTISGKEVKAPIVGTFYNSPSPTEKPYVSVGDTVKKGDILFIIESMKVMNEVQSEFSGVVKEICVNSGDSVEFDQTIMIIG